MTDQQVDDATGARGSAQEREPTRFDITIRQASLLFADLGVPRSPRSVQGFCKDGHIDAVLAKGLNGDRYFINRESIERYATELKQIEDVAKIGADNESAQLREPARDSAQQRAEPDPIQVSVDVGHDDKQKELEGAITKLREENLNLRIDNRGKEAFINQIVVDRNRLIDTVQEVSYKLGAAEGRLLQLESPKDDVRKSAQEREAVRSDNLNDTSKATIVAPADEDQHERGAANVDLKREEIQSIVPAPKRSVWKRIFS